MTEESRLSQFDELKDIITRTLDKKGVLSQLKAQLRKHVFEVLQEEESSGSSVVRLQLQSPQDRIVLELVRDYLSFHHLDYTLSLLNTETQMADEQQMKRGELASRVGLGAQTPRPVEPLLKTLVGLRYEKDVFTPHDDEDPRRLALALKPRDAALTITDRTAQKETKHSLSRLAEADSPHEDHGAAMGITSGEAPHPEVDHDILKTRRGDVGLGLPPLTKSTTASAAATTPPSAAFESGTDVDPLGDLLESDSDHGRNQLESLDPDAPHLLQGRDKSEHGEVRRSPPSSYDDEFSEVDESEDLGSDLSGSNSDGNPYAPK